MKRAIAVLALLLPAYASFAQEYRYLQTIGKEQSIQTFKMSPDASGDTYSVLVQDSLSTETHRLALAADLSTLEWVYTYPDGKRAVFTREGNSIRSEGYLPGKHPVAESEIDEAPWFGALGLGLSAFIRSGEPKTAFWTVNPQNGKAYKMIAKRMYPETISCDGLSLTAVRIVVSVSGVPTAFFKTDYWCRESDGRLLRFEGTSRGPGSPKMVLELAKEYVQ
jgi:hypothetical protein